MAHSPQDYAKAFRIVRAAYGLQQAELAARMDLSPSQLSMIEAGKRQPSVGVVERLGMAVGAPTALISLLASSTESLERQAVEDVSALSRALLRLLVTAKEEPQRPLQLRSQAK